MAILGLTRINSRLPAYLRIRPSRIPVIILCFLTLVTLYRLSSSPSPAPAVVTQQDWSKYPPRAGGPRDMFADEERVVDAAGNSVPAEMEYSQVDGLVRGWNLSGKSMRRATHPIEVLIAKGKEKWEGMLARQSKTLEEAVENYKLRYKRAPPKGFEKFYQFCVDNDVKIIDDYDQINRDIEPYFILSPEKFRSRVNDLEDNNDAYHVKLGPNGVTRAWAGRSQDHRGKQLLSLVTPIAHFVPTEITMHISNFDLGTWILGFDQRDLALTRIHRALREDGTGLNNVKFFTDSDLRRFEDRNRNGRGWVSACPDNAVARGNDRTTENKRRELEDLPPLPELPTPAFVHNPRLGQDFCFAADNLKLHGAMSYDFTRETVLRPIFVLSKMSRNPEFLFPPLEAFANATSEIGREQYLPWEQKTSNRLFWRGYTTGDHHAKRNDNPKYNWRTQSHRPRLALMTQEEKGERKIWVKRSRDWVEEKWSKQRLNEAYMDIGFAEGPEQCSDEDGTCTEMENEISYVEKAPQLEEINHKFVFDVDGNGWSERFHRLLMSGSMVIKHTIYPEWHSDWLTPWYHYVPAQIDFSDLYDIMVYFTGSPEGKVGGHEDVAEQIAANGRKFGMENWRYEDMQAYFLRLLLEYTRLLQEDRDAWRYDPSTTNDWE